MNKLFFICGLTGILMCIFGNPTYAYNDFQSDGSLTGTGGSYTPGAGGNQGTSSSDIPADPNTITSTSSSSSSHHSDPCAGKSDADRRNPSVSPSQCYNACAGVNKDFIMSQVNAYEESKKSEINSQVTAINNDTTKYNNSKQSDGYQKTCDMDNTSAAGYADMASHIYSVYGTASNFQILAATCSVAGAADALMQEANARSGDASKYSQTAQPNCASAISLKGAAVGNSVAVGGKGKVGEIINSSLNNTNGSGSSVSALDGVNANPASGNSTASDASDYINKHLNAAAEAGGIPSQAIAQALADGSIGSQLGFGGNSNTNTALTSNNPPPLGSSNELSSGSGSGGGRAPASKGPNFASMFSDMTSGGATASNAAIINNNASEARNLSSTVQSALNKNAISSLSIFQIVHLQYEKKMPQLQGQIRKSNSVE